MTGSPSRVDQIKRWLDENCDEINGDAALKIQIDCGLDVKAHVTRTYRLGDQRPRPAVMD